MTNDARNAHDACPPVERLRRGAEQRRRIESDPEGAPAKEAQTV